MYVSSQISQPSYEARPLLFPLPDWDTDRLNSLPNVPQPSVVSGVRMGHRLKEWRTRCGQWAQQGWGVPVDSFILSAKEEDQQKWKGIKHILRDCHLAGPETTTSAAPHLAQTIPLIGGWFFTVGSFFFFFKISSLKPKSLTGSSPRGPFHNSTGVLCQDGGGRGRDATWKCVSGVGTEVSFWHVRPWVLCIIWKTMAFF